MAVSMSNTGGAWDNAKKYIEAGNSEHARELGGKGSDAHKVKGGVVLWGGSWWGGLWLDCGRNRRAGQRKRPMLLAPLPGVSHLPPCLPLTPTPPHLQAAVIGDTVGDPLKDTSGPSLNILIKLMAVESLVLAPFFLAHTKDGLLFQFFKH
jgi:hypothetical protein